MLEKFGENIWIAAGDTIDVSGFRYPTRMAVIRLNSGDLMIWSPVSLTDSLRAAVDALGPVCHIIAPNSLHHLWLAEWTAAYREARLYAPPGLRNKRKDLTFDEDLIEGANAAWQGELDQTIVTGNLITQEVVFFHRQSSTVLFTDLLQQFPQDWHTGWRRVVARLDLMVEAEPTVPRKFRIAFIRRDKARKAIARILNWPAQSVLMAHGDLVTVDAAAYLKRAFRWLTG
ncbi:DUF4336 domain-containing protein [Neptunicoccus cionae]|uniref:DUF4336 domain-containing protein n=1 Tax=Neptunicoccus cionae TaxID=2035344 RepID=A0A916QWY9_9RHOB|nr:DUF4336 domain-containing protein [Amylibacter cionae]GGA17645.1 hypothetical protein GCM10011498_17820 [Amylibacter cionae]